MKSRSIDGVEEVRIPRATYRVQFHAGFTFRDALGLVPYWARLGISDLYASPVARARPGSMHGYDVCDPNELNPELGTWAEFEQLCELLQEHGMGLVLDIVPNHLGVGHESNRWWWGVLEWGERSRYAVFFDIDWGAGRLMVPVLGAAYGEVLGRGEIRLERCDRGVEVVYYEHRFPLSPEGWDRVLGELVGVGGEVGRLRESLGALIAEGAGVGKGDGVAWGEWKAGVCGLLAGDEGVAQKLDTLLAGWNEAADGGAALDGVLQLQPYRLAWWRLGITELNYRRFFDVTHLAGLRVEDPEVFLLSHELVARLWHYGHLTGLRIDHPDGLWDPAGYLRHLQRLVTEAVPEGDSPLVPDARGRVIYVVVEKILSSGEQLSRQWPVHGTTGYEVLNQLNALWVPMESAEVFTRIHGDFCGGVFGFEEEVRRNKRRVLESTLVAEWESLVGRLHALLAGTREGGDYERGVIREAVAELLSSFPVYRTYTDARRERLEGQELAQVDQAMRDALRGKSGEVADVLQLVGRILRLEWPGVGGGGGRRQAREWVMRFQQLTGPVMAKGLEDTTFYSYTRLASLNEVGGHPERFGISVREFHAANRDRLLNWPGSMVATATHDTKRGEDLRVRIDVLAEVPEVWERALIKFSTLNGEHYRVVRGERIPSASDEYLLYQTLVGLGVGSSGVVVSPELLGRVEAYMLKAVREAKVRTSWVEPNEEYERGLVEFCRRVLEGEASAAFLRELGKLSGMAVWFGRFNSLGQVLLKLTIPGVPDVYQGTEFWDLSLVDPDNRRPVDYRGRQDALKDLEGLAGRGGKGLAKRVVDLLVEGDGEVAKLWVMWRVLSMRKRESRLWLRGDYEELVVRGHLSGHVVAFARCCGRRAFVVVVPRCVVGLTGGAERLPVGEEIWGDTGIELPASLSGDGWVNRLTGEVLGAGNELRVSEVLGRFPVALLVKREEEGSEV